MPRILDRQPDPAALTRLIESGLSPLLARLYAARGVDSPEQLPDRLDQLADWRRLAQIEAAAARLADAIATGERILVLADYDADGATACAVAVRGLAALGGTVDYLVPNRFEYGYGLSPEIVRLAAERRPGLILTVDNGVAAVTGVAEAHRLGIEVLVTDHHLPGRERPACIIVNPNLPECGFPSKHLAGVGVMFYLLIATRAEQRRRGLWREGGEPALADLLELVALGTVADVVRLDANNRLLVGQGLARIRRGPKNPGIAALFAAAGRDPARAGVDDLGFALGPRLNAAGRLADMHLGIACLLADSLDAARPLAAELDRLNRERREIEADMQAQAQVWLESVEVCEGFSLTLYDPAWHPGVVGLLASRLKEAHHRPTLVFARADEGLVRGSGRSIRGLHLRDALDAIDKREPGLIRQFGGHAMAAGLTVRETDLARLAAAFEAVAREQLSPADLEREIVTDGELAAHEFGLDNAIALRDAVWGQGFPAPLFRGAFTVKSQQPVAERHRRLQLTGRDWPARAMLFNQAEPLPPRIEAVYRLDLDEWNGRRELRLIVEHWQAT